METLEGLVPLAQMVFPELSELLVHEDTEEDLVIQVFQVCPDSLETQDHRPFMPALQRTHSTSLAKITL